MNKVISIDRRGTLTLPKPMRQRLALPEDGGVLIAEETAEGVLLRAGRVVPTETYTDEEVAAFQRADEELRAFLPKLERKSKGKTAKR